MWVLPVTRMTRTAALVLQNQILVNSPLLWYLWIKVFRCLIWHHIVRKPWSWDLDADSLALLVQWLPVSFWHPSKGGEWHTMLNEKHLSLGDGFLRGRWQNFLWWLQEGQNPRDTAEGCYLEVGEQARWPLGTFTGGVLWGWKRRVA